MQIVWTVEQGEFKARHAARTTDGVNECHNSPDLIANQCKQFVLHEALQETPMCIEEPRPAPQRTTTKSVVENRIRITAKEVVVVVGRSGLIILSMTCLKSIRPRNTQESPLILILRGSSIINGRWNEVVRINYWELNWQSKSAVVEYKIYYQALTLL